METDNNSHEFENTQRRMLSVVHSAGILHDDVLKLYRETRRGYEETLLNISELVECHEVEYQLWKLHYKLIDEFRRTSKKRSENDNCKSRKQNTDDKGLQKFKSFLSEATEFYKKLIVELRKRCGVIPDIFISSEIYRSSTPVEYMKLQACQHTCHRLLVCLGDLARYTEIVKKPEDCEWSTAASYYLEATRTWPDSGNPHNQLGLLATYVGDALLALYHFVRSLSVKEPFPDAWGNIDLLFEENRSIKLPSTSNQMQLDFSNPSRRSYLQNTSDGENDSSPQQSKSVNLERIHDENCSLWDVLIRTISFAMVGSSSEEFPSALASALYHLEHFLAVDDTKLHSYMESYQQMDSSRRGPYRALHLVSIFIFTLEFIGEESPEKEESTRKQDGGQCAPSKSLAFAAIFIFMGRITERCLKGNHKEYCPLLPAVLVFLEWLAGKLNTVEAYAANGSVSNSVSYFFDALADLLHRMKPNQNRNELKHDDALWEDHELRGFHPLTHVHEKLDFTSHLECMNNYKIRNECRSQRIFHAAKIAYTSKQLTKWISYHEVGRLFDSVCSSEQKEPAGEVGECPKNTEKAKTTDCPGPKHHPSAEEDEVILFKPFTRLSSAPVYKKQAKEPYSPEEVLAQKGSNEEMLRRTTSCESQNMEDTPDSFSFCTTTAESELNQPFTSAPSLSSWVLARESSNIEFERDTTMNDLSKQKSIPIEEMASTSSSNLCIDAKADTIKGHTQPTFHNSSPCAATTPTPSAPLLPDYATWARGNPSFRPEYKNEANGILGRAPVSGYSNNSPVSPQVGFVPGFADGYPCHVGMSSSEWLYRYINSQNMQGNHISHHNAPVYGDFPLNELPRPDIWDQWGNHHLASDPRLYLGSPQLYPNSYAHGIEEPNMDKLYLGYQRPFPYVCGIGMDLNTQQQPLLQYLKERERQLQTGSQLRGTTFMGN